MKTCLQYRKAHMYYYNTHNNNNNNICLKSNIQTSSVDCALLLSMWDPSLTTQGQLPDSIKPQTLGLKSLIWHTQWRNRTQTTRSNHNKCKLNLNKCHCKFDVGSIFNYARPTPRFYQASNPRSQVTHMAYTMA